MRQRLSLKARALQLLSQREHSRVELRRKLLAHVERLAADAPARRSGPAGAATVPADAAPALGESPASTTRRAPPSAEARAGVEALLDEFAANGLLSEARFVEARVRARAARHGSLRIEQELARHGLQLPADAAQGLKASEFARARAVWVRKFGAQPPLDAAGRARQMRFLAGRGFSGEVIRRLLRAGADDD